MANSSLLQTLFTQAWQLAALALVVAVCVRYFARNRPHLAHALWLVVLLKCVTPPLWGSPIGVCSWLSTTHETSAAPAVALAEDGLTHTSAALAVADDTLGPADVVVDARRRSPGKHYSPGNSSEATSAAPSGMMSLAVRLGLHASELCRAAIMLWIGGVLTMSFVSVLRLCVCVRRLRRSETIYRPDLEALVAELSVKLRVRRRVRLWITDSRIGPAVMGLIRPTILLPECVVLGRTAADLSPILAHELIHVRRGDLWVGLLQTVAQALWWFHPLVWLAGRMISREAERCCDEEVIGELRCEPARYARSLLGVLEWKRILVPAPAVPGVRAVEITSQRLERIMTLGQGCRRRTPWWCWGTMLVVAALALPGSPMRISATEPDKGAPAPDSANDSELTRPPAPQAESAIPRPFERAQPESKNSPAPIVFPKELDAEVDVQSWMSGHVRYEWNLGADMKKHRTDPGKPLQVWGLSDLVRRAQKDLEITRERAKQVVWMRLWNAQYEQPAPVATLSVATDVTSKPENEPADGEPFWQGDTLILSQAPQRDKRTKAAIEEMRKYGFQSLEVKVQFVTAPLELITKVSNRWTTLPMAQAADGATALPLTAIGPPEDATSGVASFAVERNLPVLLDVLGEMRAAALVDGVQGDRASNILQAPRLRLFNGQSAHVMDCTQQPFVVGFRENKPQIHIVREGVVVRVRPVLADENVRLNFEVVSSGIRSVDEMEVPGADGTLTKVQSPLVAQSRVSATLDVPLGKTMLIGGLRDIDNPQSKQSLAVLLTVKRAPLDVDKPAVEQTSQDAEPAANADVREEPLYTLVYATADLVIPLPTAGPLRVEKKARPQVPPWAKPNQPGASARKDPNPQADKKPKPEFEPLIDLITSTVLPESWQANGGRGVIQAFPNNLSVVISQTKAGHKATAALLKDLRKELRRQVVLDIHTVDDVAKLLQMMNADGAPLRRQGMQVFSPEVTERAYKASDRPQSMNIKATIFNGGCIKLPIVPDDAEPPETTFLMQPSIAADGRGFTVLVGDPKSAGKAAAAVELSVVERGSILIDVSRFDAPAAGEKAQPAGQDGTSKPRYLLISPRIILADDVDASADLDQSNF